MPIYNRGRCFQVLTCVTRVAVLSVPSFPHSPSAFGPSLLLSCLNYASHSVI